MGLMRMSDGEQVAVGDVFVCPVNANSATLHVAAAGGAIGLEVVVSNIGDGNYIAPDLDGGGAIALADGGSDFVLVDLPVALLGVRVVSADAGAALTCVLCSTGV